MYQEAITESLCFRNAIIKYLTVLGVSIKNEELDNIIQACKNVISSRSVDDDVIMTPYNSGIILVNVKKQMFI